MSAMFDDYGAKGPAYDEMFDGPALRSPYRRLRSTLRSLTTPELVSRVEALQLSYLDQGVTFDIGGEERAFPLDILPRVIEVDTWRRSSEASSSESRLSSCSSPTCTTPARSSTTVWCPAG